MHSFGVVLNGIEFRTMSFIYKSSTICASAYAFLLLGLTWLVFIECTLGEGFSWRMLEQADTVPCRASQPTARGSNLMQLNNLEALSGSETCMSMLDHNFVGGNRDLSFQSRLSTSRHMEKSVSTSHPPFMLLYPPPLHLPCICETSTRKVWSTVGGNGVAVVVLKAPIILLRQGVSIGRIHEEV